MAKPEWGTKRTCPKCSTRFYDLANDDPVNCINCGFAWMPEPILKSKQPMPFEAPKKKEVEAEEKEDEIDDEDLDLDEAEDVGDPDDLGDHEDIATVVEPSDNDDEV